MCRRDMTDWRHSRVKRRKADIAFAALYGAGDCHSIRYVGGRRALATER